MIIMSRSTSDSGKSSHSRRIFSDSVTFTLSDSNGIIIRALWETLLQAASLLLICFFGLFLFPTISFIFGRANYKYLSFGFLCFFWAVFRLVHIESWFMNSLIIDPVVCMTIYSLTVYAFFSALIIYFRSNLRQDLSRKISGAAALIFLIAVFAVVILQLTTVTI